MFLPRRVLERKLLEMLAEDVGQGDITAQLTVPAHAVAEAKITAKEPGIASGIEEAEILLESLGLRIQTLVKDGEEIKKNQTLIRISGNARTMLSVERTVLNVLSRMSGIATTVGKLTARIRKARLKAKVACTRKTAPGLLYFDKKAVLIGGGDTHRLHLDDMILIKDNHIAVAGSIEEAVKRAASGASFSKKIEVEVSNTDDAIAAAKAGADIIMFDNLTPRQLENAITSFKRAKLHGKILLEASGGITAENILDFASKEVDLVSLGEITNSSKALNVSLKITKTDKKGQSAKNV